MRALTLSAMWTPDQVLRKAIPAIIAMLSPAITRRVVDALRLLGLRKLGTPLLTASTPVREVQPEAKARSSRINRAAPVGGRSTKPRLADSATGMRPLSACQKPAPSMMNTLMMNP